MDNKLLIEDEIARVSEIDYEGDEVLTQQKSGALAVNDLVSRFPFSPPSSSRYYFVSDCTAVL